MCRMCNREDYDELKINNNIITPICFDYIHLAFSLDSQIIKLLFSVSRQTAKYPIPVTGLLG